MGDSAADLMIRADLARKEKRLSDAQRDLTEAVAVFRKESRRRELVHALKKLGQIERDLGHGDAARPLYEEAVALCRDQGDALSLAHTVRHLGDIHLDAGRYDMAEPSYQEALAIYRFDKRTHPLDLANAIRPFAILKDNTGHSLEAALLWEEARQLYEDANVTEGVAECKARLAILSHQRNGGKKIRPPK